MATEEKTSFGMKIAMGWGILCLVFGAYKCSQSVLGSENKETTSTEQVAPVEQTQADNKCYECDGTGVVSTYGLGGNATGSKTCPACKGTGKDD
ncbi:DnaJ-class molecular chaperone [Flavobacterium sp. 28YEA47A]|uniref:hypothetical protein n=1 Tax=Flavobacterium sp. 28YEA47A TaxID=3156276 RepID=UPI00351181B5